MTPEQFEVLVKLISAGGPWGIVVAVWFAARHVRLFFVRLALHWEREETSLAAIEAAVTTKAKDTNRVPERCPRPQILE